MSSKHVHAELRLLEERLAMPAASETCASLGALLAPEFWEFGSSGVIHERGAVLDALVPGGRPGVLIEDFKTTKVGDGVVLVTYRTHSAVAGGKPAVLRSSLWVWRAHQWQIVFHQGTRMPPDAP